MATKRRAPVERSAEGGRRKHKGKLPPPERARRPRPRRRPLDRDGIERAALELIDREGLEELSMRRLGKKLGVEAMSLYHHFPSKAHLLDALLDRLIAKLEDPDPALPWRERATASCNSYRRMMVQHPRFAPFMLLHRMNTRTALGWLESVARVLADAGLGDEEGARALRTIGYFLMGAILDETAGYAAGPTAADPLTPGEQAEIAPTVIRFGPYFARSEWDETFRRGLTALFDEIERQAAICRAR